MKQLVVLAFGLSSIFAHSEEWHEAHNCMVDNILYESRSESYEGMMAVANVTMNRYMSDDYPDTVCGVVYEPKQFSWTHMLSVMDEIDEVVEAEVIHQARIIAADVLTYRYEDTTEGAMWYHRDDVSPDWKTDYRVVMVLGRHIFYHDADY